MKHIIYISIFAAIISSCKKDTSNCFDPDLKKQYESQNCVQDCPGVEGCDGKTYCNECIANSQGIRVE